MDELQSWEELVASLAQITWTETRQVDGGTLYLAPQLYPEALNDPGWYTSEWYFEEPPETVARHMLLGMNWISHGAPISWDGFMEMVQIGDEAGYVFLWMEGFTDAPDLLGKVVPAQTPAAYRAIFEDMIARDQSLMSLPDHVTNGRPDLLDQATLRDIFWDILQWSAAKNDYTWDDLRQRVDKPSAGLVAASDKARTAPVEDAGAAFSEAECQALLDRYFANHYDEVNDQ